MPGRLPAKSTEAVVITKLISLQAPGAKHVDDLFSDGEKPSCKRCQCHRNMTCAILSRTMFLAMV